MDAYSIDRGERICCVLIMAEPDTTPFAPLRLPADAAAEFDRRAIAYRNRVEWLESEVRRLTEENMGLLAKIEVLEARLFRLTEENRRIPAMQAQFDRINAALDGALDLAGDAEVQIVDREQIIRDLISERNQLRQQIAAMHEIAEGKQP